ncbi:hypothetical protein L7F22_031363 [Adiantum nelumboides]|nr:hypothetical protein [Adiantum nelumboides]
MSRKHQVDDCPCAIDECSMGNARKSGVWLINAQSSIICKVHKALEWGETKNALQTLADFEDDLENAFEWLDNHRGDMQKSCSSRKSIKRLQKACEKLRDTFEDEFEGGLSDDDDI